MMMPPTPRTVSPAIGWHSAVASWIDLIATESVQVAFGNCVAEATPAVHSTEATARMRVNILCMCDPLVAGGRNDQKARSGGLAAGGFGLLALTRIDLAASSPAGPSSGMTGT